MDRKLAAIIAGDVVGYSRLMAEDEASTYSQLQAVLKEIVDPAVRQHAGRIFKSTGDGFLATFPSVNEALDAAIEIQEGFSRRTLQLRIGLNLGDVIEDDGDVFGDGVNVASRLEAMAEPGTIYVSAAVVRSADKSRKQRFERIGRRRAKNMPDTIDVYALRCSQAASRSVLGLPWRSAMGGRAVRVGSFGLIAATVLLGGEWATNTTGLFPYIERSTSARAAMDDRPAVAVLPFDNLSGDPSQAYFTDGLTEDIITDLARHRELMVIARNSTFAFRDRPTDIREVGAALNAGYVVEGSARRVGDQLRVVAQLIDAGTGAHVWSRSYDRRVEDVFAVQTDLTAQIVASLVSYVRQSESAAAEGRPTKNLRAYDLVLQGRDRHKHGSNDRVSLLEARQLFERAARLDPDYAAAHAYLGLTYLSDRPDDDSALPPANLERGLAQARQAISLEPDLPLGYQVLSFALALSGDYEGSLRVGERAVELSPSDPDSLMALAKAQMRFGAYEDAVASAERARRLHPMAPEYYTYIHGQALYAAERLQEADEVLSECLLRAPQEEECLRTRAAVLVRLDRIDEAREAMAVLLRVDAGFSLSTEAAVRRFGNSPLMERYLSDLARAQAPASAAQTRPGEARQT